MASHTDHAVCRAQGGNAFGGGPFVPGRNDDQKPCVPGFFQPGDQLLLTSFFFYSSDAYGNAQDPGAIQSAGIQDVADAGNHIVNTAFPFGV